ncbi:hypothetical protein F4679DRAFT_534047 [Xylaria curta]|nr:hypothetical protein F4679DRAFT_534047 [Xylaria curta]
MSLAPAVSRDGFSYAGDLYVEASGQNRHRRAAISELKQHFKSGSDRDHPAHWFEAQLIHYGLQPSKTKSVARMRLFDAVNSGKLAVPSHIKKIETDLKKEWTKNERDAKKAVKPTGSTSAASATAAGQKRKADSSNVDITVNVGGINITVSANSASTSSSAAKKTKTSATATPAKARKEDPKKKAAASKAVKDGPKPKASTASKAKATTSTPSSKKLASTAPSSSASTSATPIKKQTARRGGISPRRGSTSVIGAARSPRTKQTARRGGAFVARGRIPTSSAADSNNDFDEPPPPYSEYDNSERYDSDRSDYPSLPSLGLLNGRYDIFSHEANGQWGCDDFDLVLTLSGRELWGKFDLGIISGILHFNERPWDSSEDRVPFTWRGEEREGQIWYGNNHRGWIKFLGDGRIEGELDYMSLDFSGERVSGRNTRSEIDAQSMRREWDGYSEEEYERLNRARWR